MHYYDTECVDTNFAMKFCKIKTHFTARLAQNGCCYQKHLLTPLVSMHTCLYALQLKM